MISWGPTPTRNIFLKNFGERLQKVVTHSVVATQAIHVKRFALPVEHILLLNAMPTDRPVGHHGGRRTSRG